MAQFHAASDIIPMGCAAARGGNHLASDNNNTQQRAGLKVQASALTVVVADLLENQERESSDSPMLKAFWRVAPSVRFSFLAICDAGVFLRAKLFRSRTSPEVHARRFFVRFAINPPFQERQFVSLTGVEEKPTDEMWITTFGGQTIAADLYQSRHRRTSTGVASWTNN
jgi:hypothetical protein